MDLSGHATEAVHTNGSKTMITFATPWVWLLLPTPWLVYRLWRHAPKQASAALRLPFFSEWRTWAQGQVNSPTRAASRARLWIPALIWLLLVAAAARPQWLGDPLPLSLSGRDLMLAIDVSGSMEIQDFDLGGRQVTRLDVIKKTAGEFIERRAGDRLGLILFGTHAYLQTPLTFDRTSVRASLLDATIGLAGKETAIGEAIGLAIKRLRDGPIEQRVLVLLTDGANTAGTVNPNQAAQLAKEAGLRIYTIGIGAESMTLETNPFFGPRVVNPSRDLDESTLRLIAESTGGEYFRAKDTAALEEIYLQLDSLEPRESEAEIFRPVTPLFHWPLGAALLLSYWLAWLAVSRPKLLSDHGAP